MIWLERPIKTIVVGCGGMGEVHLRMLTKLKQFRVTAAVDLNDKRLGEIKAKYGVKNIFEDFDAAFKSGDFEAAVISTPHHLHKKQVNDCLSRNIHVFIEKPIGLSLTETDEMISAAEKYKRELVVGHVMRFWPNVNLARETIRKGGLGSIKHIVRRRDMILKKAGEREWSRDVSKSGGWLVFGNASHEIDTVLYMTGLKITELTAYGAVTNPYWNDYDELDIVVRYENGATGAFSMTFNAEKRMNETLIIGDKGVIRINEADLYKMNELQKTLSSDDGLGAQLIEFATAIRKKVPDRACAQSVRPTIAVLESVRRSLKEKKSIKVSY